MKVMRSSPPQSKPRRSRSIEGRVTDLFGKSWHSMVAIRRSAPEYDGSIWKKRFPGRARITRGMSMESHEERNRAAARRASHCRLGNDAAGRVRQRGRDLIRSPAGLDGGDAYAAVGRQRVDAAAAAGFAAAVIEPTAS